jgi:4-amino-4-deoxy-L-arabinose transferase-like glycosyltransferase
VAAERPLTRAAAWPERLRISVRNPARTAVVTFTALLVISIGARIWLARQIVSPWIMGDELLYSEMAKSFATSGHFLIRDAPSGIGNVVYPGLISPAWLFHPMATTYGLAKGINVVVMTATAVPVYLWGRRLASPLYALVAAALVLLMPSFVYTGTLMTENAFLPAFLLAAFTFALALERPTLLRQLTAFGAILLAIAIRYQGLVLLLVLPTAIVLKVVFELCAAPRPRPVRFLWSELRRYWISAALLVGAVCFYVVLQVARGHELASGLGSYQAIVGKGYSFDASRHWVLLHFAELSLSVAVFPVSAFLVLLGLAFVRGGTRSEAERAFLAVTTAAVPWIVLEVAVFASRFSLRVEERYMFFLAPLLFLALAVWLDRGLPRPPLLAVAAAVIPAALLFALPLASLLNVSILSDTFGLIPLLRLSNLVPGGIPEVRHFLLAGGIGAAIVFMLWPRNALPQVVFPASVAAFLVLSTYPIVGTLHDYSRALRDSAGIGGSASWIDNRIGSGSKASFLLGTTLETWPETLGLWQNEFWNRSLGPVYNLSTPEPTGGPESPVRVEPRTGLIVSTATGKPVVARYVASSLAFGLDGQLIAARPPFALYRTDGSLRVAQATAGIYGDGWMSADASYTRFVARSRGKLTVTLSRAAWTGTDVPGRVRVQLAPLRGPRAGQAVATRRWVLHSGGGHAFTLSTPNRPFAVTVHVAPTFSPSTYGQPDTRQLGAQLGFHYRPDGG